MTGNITKKSAGLSVRGEVSSSSDPQKPTDFDPQKPTDSNPWDTTPTDPQTPRPTDPPKGIDSLLVLMTRLEGLHHQLHEALQHKLNAMRKASIEELATRIDQEQKLVTRISEQEGLRRKLMEQIGRGYGMSATIARNLPVRELAQRVPESTRTRLLAVSGSLKAAVERVRKINNLVSRVSTDVLRHMEAVFSSVRATDSPSSSYTDRGQTAPPHPLELFEAIG